VRLAGKVEDEARRGMQTQNATRAALDGTGRDPQVNDRLLGATTIILSTAHTPITTGVVNHDRDAWWWHAAFSLDVALVLRWRTSRKSEGAA
jgi:hypothetical protein